MRRMDNIKRCGIISPTIKERASVKRKLQSDYVNPNDLELEATPTELPKQDPRVRVTNGNVESIMEQLSSETSKALKSAVEDIFDTDMDLSDRSCSTPPSPLAVSSDDSRFGGLNGSAALTNSESGLDTLPDDSHDSVTGNDSFLESLASENEQLKKKYEAQERELIKLRRTGLQQAALLQKLGESTSQSATSTQTQPNVALRPTQNTPPPVVPSQGQVGVQQVPRVDDSLFPPSPPSPPSQHQRQHQETEEQQLQQNQQQRQEGASHPAPVASESVRSYVRKAYYPLPTGDYVLNPSLVRRAPSEMNAFARFMLVGVFGRDGIKGRSLYGGSVKSNTIETRPPLDPHKMNAILNLCQQRFGRKDPAFEGKFGNAARNKLPKNRSKA